MENIPLKVLQSINSIEKAGVTGEYKKESVIQSVLSLIDDNVNIEQMIDDLIELLISISRKKIKILVNKDKCGCI